MTTREPLPEEAVTDLLLAADFIKGDFSLDDETADRIEVTLRRAATQPAAMPEEEVMRRCEACNGSGYDLEDVRKYGDLQKRCEVCEPSAPLPPKPKVDEDAAWLRRTFASRPYGFTDHQRDHAERIAARLESGA